MNQVTEPHPCACGGPDLDLEDIDRIVAEIGDKRHHLLAILRTIQSNYHYLPEAALRRVCEITEITPQVMASVSTFYPRFRHTPMGDHTIDVCDGTACHVKGAERVFDAIKRELNIDPDNDTDPEGRFTIQKVACLGCCTLAPVVRINEVVYGHIRPDSVPGMLEDFIRQLTQGGRRKTAGPRKRNGECQGEVRVGLGSCCVAGGSGKVKDELEHTLDHLEINAEIKPVGCVGMCHHTPLLEVVRPDNANKLYTKVKPKDVKRIVLRHFTPNPLKKWKALLYHHLEQFYTDETTHLEKYTIDVRDPPVAAFLDRQQHIATEFCGFLEPGNLEEYRQLGGMEGLLRAVKEYKPADILDIVKQSNLRGRGGAGFPSWRKWSFVIDAKNPEKYIVCNGDEGDPGAFMDRMIMESYPFRLLEGMMIAAYTIGAREAFLYIRDEYPLAVLQIKDALKQLEKAGFIGKNPEQTGVPLTFNIIEGAGAFVCGEETALIASIEGRRGTPTFRPPYPAVRGLWGRPTLVNNVETYSLIPWILRNGAEAFNKMGTEKSKGTKVFSLAGKIVRGGLIEVPMGITLRQIVDEIGGGIADGRQLKAVQVGGPSGGCIPVSLMDTPVDYEALTKAGAMMGSGGLVVLDDSDCMVDVARYFLSFTQIESCGKCTPCRVGTRVMLDLLEDLCAGRGKKGDVEKLEHIAEVIRTQSLCGLGKTAPNPVLTTIKYFRDEYEAHIAGHCPTGKCKGLIAYEISDDCIGCTKCAQQCPVDAIAPRPYKLHEIIHEKCTQCDTCRLICPVDAVKVVNKKS